MSTTDSSSRLVLVTTNIDDRWLERLQALSPDLRIERYPEARIEDIPAERWQRAEVLYTLQTLPTPEQAPRLRWVQLYSAGANQALNSPLLENGVLFTTMSGVHAVNIAEYVFTTLLAWFHRFPRMLEWQRQGQWPSDSERNALFMPQELREKTLNIVGYGSIGREVARLAKGFGMRILALERSSDHHDRGYLFPSIGDPDGSLPDLYYTTDELHAMLAESDIVVIALPLTSQTKGLFDAAAFQAMKSSAFLVNIGRGDICDEQALIAALQEQRIAGAALDVFHQEPLPTDSPFYRLANVFISPHISGLTPQYDERAAQVFAENLRRYLAGQPLYNMVDPQQGY